MVWGAESGRSKQKQQSSRAAAEQRRQSGSRGTREAAERPQRRSWAGGDRILESPPCPSPSSTRARSRPADDRLSCSGDGSGNDASQEQPGKGCPTAKSATRGRTLLTRGRRDRRVRNLRTSAAVRRSAIHGPPPFQSFALPAFGVLGHLRLSLSSLLRPRCHLRPLPSEPSASSVALFPFGLLRPRCHLWLSSPSGPLPSVPSAASSPSSFLRHPRHLWLSSRSSFLGHLRPRHLCNPCRLRLSSAPSKLEASHALLCCSAAGRARPLRVACPGAGEACDVVRRRPRTARRPGSAALA